MLNWQVPTPTPVGAKVCQQARDIVVVINKIAPTVFSIGWDTYHGSDFECTLVCALIFGNSLDTALLDMESAC